MRILAAILLLGLLLFNWVGYRVLHAYLQDQATSKLQAQLDKDQYLPDQLLRLKVPITFLSYYNQSNEFEHIEGRVDINGIPYQYVARRIANDSAEYLCVPNNAAKSLQATRDRYFSLVNDFRQSPKSQKGSPDGPGQNYFGDPYLLPEPRSFAEYSYTRLIRSYYNNLQLPTGVYVLNDRPPTIFA